MSPEEIAWDNGGSVSDGRPFKAHLSGDIHTAGSIIHYILTGGLHCFGAASMWQQVNIAKGNPDFKLLRASDPVAADLVARMVYLQPNRRLQIREVTAHPMFWDAAARLEKVRSWKVSWRRGADLKRRLDNHPRAVAEILGGAGRNRSDGGDVGWMSALDPAVAAQLTAWKDGYDGRDMLDLVRAIRNIFEHWFERDSRADATEAEAARRNAVELLTGWDESKMRRGHQSKEGQEMRAVAVAGYFLERRFPSLLLVFEFSREA
jgi:hypothetical protein